MKELSIEEKAKRYDEAKLRMSAAYNSNRCTIGLMNERMKAKNYPTKQEVLDKYQELHSWQKVADFYNITRRIVQRIRVA